MKPLVVKKAVVQSVTLLTMALMVYAAVSKMIDYENFQVQIGQSPMLSAFAGWLAVAVPAIELAIATLLAFPRTRLVGNLAAFSLMAMFTAYIFIILNYGSYIPCSCGGILEKLGWEEHLYFNIFFVVISFVAVIIEIELKGSSIVYRPFAFVGSLLGIFVLSTAVVIGLFVWSENIIHNRNNFIRRYAAFNEPESRKYDLKTPSYYFAGASGSTIYLGNMLAPRHVLAIDTTFKWVKRIVIELDKMDLPFRAVYVRVDPPYFL